MSNLTETARAYARQHADEFRRQLHELIRIPSVSADPAHSGDVARAAEWIAADMRRIGVHQVQVMPTGGNPVVYGEWLEAGPDAPTVLIYGHYDVQPAESGTGWDTDPFEPVERDGFIYARGSSDDKGQMFIHLKVFESYLQGAGGLPVNVKFLLEGEEEISSQHLPGFIERHRDLLKADLAVISDSGMQELDQPAITYGLRGLTYMEIHVTGPAKDLHSGQYGGIVHNPALALVEILSRMHNPDHSVAVPGFYDDVAALSDAERDALRRVDITPEWLAETAGVTTPWGEAAYTLRERVGARPTFEINGLVSGWTGEGPKTVLPAKAMAKVSCRLVGNQNPQRIYELVRDYVAQITPPTVRSEVRLLSTGDPVLVDINDPAMQAAVRAYRRGWGAEPVFMREGGSIPVGADMQKILNLPVLFMGYGLNSDGAHGPNERFGIENFHRGIDTAIIFLEEVKAG
ncbi:MAG: dipeptidase [Candidatus Flexifilum sp.]